MLRPVVRLRLRCTGAVCEGTVKLSYRRTLVAGAAYTLRAGKTGSVALRLSKQAMKLVERSQSKALSVTETVAVASGRTSTQSVLKAYGPGT